jgi:hypothetical protein
MDSSLRWLCSQHPTWQIAMPEAGAIQLISGADRLTPHSSLDWKTPNLAHFNQPMPEAVAV